MCVGHDSNPDRGACVRGECEREDWPRRNEQKCAEAVLGKRGRHAEVNSIMLPELLHGHSDYTRETILIRPSVILISRHNPGERRVLKLRHACPEHAARATRLVPE